MAYRAFWLDTQTGDSIELGRGVAVEVHIQYVLQNPETFGFTGRDAQQLEAMARGRIPYELSDYPEWLVKRLLSRWVKVRVDERYINFTTQDRPTRKQIEAMQDFATEKRFRRGVFLMGEPSGKILARFTRLEDFMLVRQPGELRRVAACTLQEGQVWRRRDGLCYRLVDRVGGGWTVDVGREHEVSADADASQCWSFTDRHMHNLIATERLQLCRASAASVIYRLRAAGLRALASQLVVALLPDDVSDAQDTEQTLREKIEETDDEQYREQLKDALVKTQDTLVEEGPRTKPGNRVATPNYVGRDSVREPNRITR